MSLFYVEIKTTAGRILRDWLGAADEQGLKRKVSRLYPSAEYTILQRRVA